MPKYYGCPCEGCGKPLTLQDDIVVCPDCGAPYHRTCYEKMGLCIHAPAHGAGYEWKFPYQDAQLRTCPTCGERTLRSENVCRCCGAALPPESPTTVLPPAPSRTRILITAGCTGTKCTVILPRRSSTRCTATCAPPLARMN